MQALSLSHTCTHAHVHVHVKTKTQQKAPSWATCIFSTLCNWPYCSFTFYVISFILFFSFCFLHVLVSAAQHRSIYPIHMYTYTHKQAPSTDTPTEIAKYLPPSPHPHSSTYTKTHTHTCTHADIYGRHRTSSLTLYCHRNACAGECTLRRLSSAYEPPPSPSDAAAVRAPLP